MGKRGPKPVGRVKIKWSPDFAYAIGLIATDGCLSKDGRHIDFTSKDKELADNFQKTLGVTGGVGMKSRSKEREKKYFRIQLGDVAFYKFLNSIGLTAHKSLTIGALKIPRKYFFDFLRGCFDGDGTVYSYWDKRWKSSFMFYLAFASSSREFIDWLRGMISKELGATGHITSAKGKSCFQLKYAKRDSLKIIKKMYKKDGVPSLSRKRLKIKKILAIIGKSGIIY